MTKVQALIWEGETCSHIIGFITALCTWQLMGLTEVPSELPCTSLPQRWSVPRGTKIDPEPVPHMTFVNPKPVRKKRPIRNTLTDNRKIRVQDSDLEVLKGLDNCPLSYLVTKPENTIGTHLGSVPVASGLSTHAVFFEPIASATVGTTCGDLVFPQTAMVTLSDQCGISNTMTKEECINIEQKTRDQAASPAWFEARKNRLTASNFGVIVKRQKVTDKFIQCLLQPKQFNSAATSYGKNNEKKAIQKYIKKSSNHVHECGFVINDKFQFIGATPDAKVCEEGTTGIVEVKCPYSARDITVREACDMPGFFMTDRDGTLSLKSDHQHYYQVQGQLMVTGVEFCDFVVFTKKDLVIQRIFPDLIFMQDLLDKLTEFHCQYVKPKLMPSL